MNINIVTQAVYDAQLKMRCVPSLAEDGIARCLPDAVGPVVDVFFSDNACTSSIVAAGLGSGPCTKPTPKYAFRTVVGADQCTTALSVWSVGNVYTGTVYLKNGSTCIQTTANSYTLFVLGPKIDPTTFAPIDVKTVP